MAGKKKDPKILGLVPADEETKSPKKGLKALISELNRDPKFRSHNSITLGSDLKDYEVIPSGILRLDYALGVGGFPRGKIVQIYGNESSWKSTVCMRTVAQAQKMGGQCAWFDAERSFDKRWAQTNGVDLDNIAIIEPDTMEDCLNTIEKMARAGVDVIVLDSLAALAPHKEMYSDDNKAVKQPLDKEGMALAARLWSKWFRQAPGYIAKNGSLFMIINQLRSSLSPYGNPVAVPGGKAVAYYNSITINLKRVTAKDGQVIDSVTKQVIGGHYNFTIEKTKFGVIGNGGQFKVVGKTVDNFTTLKDIGIQVGLIEKINTSNYLVNGEKINGAGNVEIYIAKHPEYAKELEKQIRERMGFNVPEVLGEYSTDAEYESVDDETLQNLENVDDIEDTDEE